jgi:hypothetical protein
MRKGGARSRELDGREVSRFRSGNSKSPQPFTLDSNGHLFSNGLMVGAPMDGCQFEEDMCDEEFPRGYTLETYAIYSWYQPMTCNLTAGALDCMFSYVDDQSNTVELRYAALQTQDLNGINGQQTIWMSPHSWSIDVTLQAVDLSACRLD